MIKKLAVGSNQLPVGWQIKTLDEVSRVVNGGTPKTKIDEYWGGQHYWITPAEMGNRSSPFVSETKRTLTDAGLQKSSAQLVPPLSSILSTRAPIGHLVINTKLMAFNQGCRGLVSGENLEYKFLHYFLINSVCLLNDLGTGATFKELSAGKLKGVQIPMPPLPEQKRIVAILDEVFAGISQTVANAEKNLANARELFESYLNNVFTQKDEGWVEKKIGECFRVKSGDFLPKRNMNLEGDIDVYGGNGPTGKHDEYNLKGNNVVIGRVGAKCGNVRSIDQQIWLTDNAFYVSEIFQEFDYDFLSMLLRRANLGSTANQAAQPVISYKTIKPVILSFPQEITDQQKIFTNSQQLLDETQHLETIYQQKLTALAELKQSILQKAFAGKLTRRD